jgi:hypothetical protein
VKKPAKKKSKSAELDARRKAKGLLPLKLDTQVRDIVIEYIHGLIDMQQANIDQKSDLEHLSLAALSLAAFADEIWNVAGNLGVLGKDIEDGIAQAIGTFQELALRAMKAKVNSDAR